VDVYVGKPTLLTTFSYTSRPWKKRRVSDSYVIDLPKGYLVEITAARKDVIFYPHAHIPQNITEPMLEAIVKTLEKRAEELRG